METKIEERSRFIPLRLTPEDRIKLRLVEASLYVSEYTDKVDTSIFWSKSKRIHEQLNDICGILSGLAVATDYRSGQELIKGKSFEDNETFFQNMFELARRHKIMNPDKMRTEYGKLIYLIMDAQSPKINELLGFSLFKPIRTVYDFLEERDALQILRDDLITIATKEIIDDGTRSRMELQQAIKIKEEAINELAEKYASDKITKEQINLCVRSIGDSNVFIAQNVRPIDRMIEYLKKYFNPETVESGYSLAITAGIGGARLTHSHKRQYYYVLQSLTLWREIQHEMFRLWYLAESDLLDPNNPYSLRDTGQGLNRVQGAPRIGRAIYRILSKTQEKVGTWVGSSVVHLGDHNVPNALMFIDKYTQVPRIINPIMNTIDNIDGLMNDEGLKLYIESVFGTAEVCKKRILQDFFKHGFDGSGADNFFDAGSCIDGRLTSAWNWCSKLEKKEYYPIFRLTGFIGFDGDFQK